MVSSTASSWFQRDRVGPQPAPNSSSGGSGGRSSLRSSGRSRPGEPRDGDVDGTSGSSPLHRTIAACLHPRPPRPPVLAAASRSAAAGGFGGGSSSDCSSPEFGGLSPLLLEHGERPLADWAVVVSSNPVVSPASAPHSYSDAGAATRTDSRGGSIVGGPIQWAQAPEAVKHYRGQVSSSSASSSPHRSGRPHRGSSGASKSVPAQPNRPPPDDKDAHPSCHLSRLEARLHLCSKSLVLEPLDPSKPIWRCPLSRMTAPPKEDPVLRLEGFETVSADFVVSRHFAIPPHGAAPFDAVHVPTRFVVTFLHSSPSALVEACDKLVRASSHRGIGGGSSFASADIRPCDVPLDPEHLVDLREQIIAQFQCRLLTPLQEQPGVLAVTSERLYFQPSAWTVSTGGSGSGTLPPTASASASSSSSKVGKWSKSRIVALARRYHGLRDSAVEIFFGPAWESIPSSSFSSKSASSSNSSAPQGTSLLLALRGRHDRERLVRYLERVAHDADSSAAVPQSSSLLPRRGGLSPTPPNPPICLTSRDFVAQAFDAWHKGSLSNFDYLLVLNSAAGRSYHDLSRYPVFPWVIRDYESSKLDLTKESTFRDLTKPVGALNPQRLEYFRKRMQGMHDMGDEFLYGTHYSAPGYVLYYLVRTMPEHMLCLQNGKFDAPDRMFHSLVQCFQCVMTNHADVKEVLPQFYHPAHFDFLLNTRGLQLGATQTGDRVDDVVLPPWAKSARDFVRKNRQALESPHCTQNLPRWIDLVFGCASRGQAARDADNLFHSSAYLSPTDLDSKSDDERVQAELHATEFGIVPDKLFVLPHPRRGDALPDGGDRHSFLGDIGRASASDVDPSQGGGVSGAGGGGAWELLDHPTASVELPIPTEDVQPGKVAPTEVGSAELRPLNDPSGSPGRSSVAETELSTPVQAVPLRGKGEAASHQSRRNFQYASSGSFDRGDGAAPHRSQPPSPVRTFPDAPSSEWDMKILERKHIHGDAVSGCALLLEGDSQPSMLATTSLDGGLKVHKLSLGPSDDEPERKGFPSTLSRFSYSTILSRGGPVGQAPSAPSKLTEYRSHTSRDPLASLVLATDGESGRVAFAGGHDDVVLAYGINSACAVASIYSHRDAVTGLDLIPRTPSDPEGALWLEKSTHIMVSGSWDATVKVWSATVSGGEAVAINREPLAELFDADSSIVSVTAQAAPNGGIIIGAGCADGGFCVWAVHNDGMQVVVHKEAPRRGSGPCSVVKWVSEGGRLSLFAAFSTGIVSSYALVDGALQRLSAVSIGVAVLSLVHAGGHLWVGSSDGALRLIPLREGGYFEKPTLWSAANHKSSPGISSISVTSTGPAGGPSANDCFVCCTGGEDGSVALFEIHRRAPSS